MVKEPLTSFVYPGLPARRGHDYVFTGPEGGLLNGNALRDRSWYPTLTKTSLSRRTMYQTQHTFASNALASGESLVLHPATRRCYKRSTSR